MVSINSGGGGEEHVMSSSTPPPLPSRKEVLPDPATLIRDRRSAAGGPDQPALPPKVSYIILYFMKFLLLYFNKG